MNHRSSQRYAAAVLIAFFVWHQGGVDVAAAEGPRRSSEFEPEVQWREPVALVRSSDGNWLFVANRESGTVSVIDVGRRSVVLETKVADTLADLVAVPDGSQLLAVDEQAGKVLLLATDGPEIAILGSVDIASTPVRVAVDPTGEAVFVTSLWSRRVSVLSLQPADSGPTKLSLDGEIELTFEPLCLIAVGSRKAVVTDAFGGELAVVDGPSHAVDSVRTLPAHNIRGLGLSLNGEQLLLTHQMHNQAARTDQNDIHWAGFMTSNLRSLQLVDVLDPSADPIATGRVYHISDVGDGGADPNGLLAMPDGTLAVTLGGVDEIAFGPEHVSIGHRVPVGRRPVALAEAPGPGLVFVADAFDDTVSIVALKDGARAEPISLGPHPEPDEIQTGRMLFHDARLSHDGWMSCHSCHTDGHTNGRLVDTLGDDSYGTPKRTLTLRGAGETGPWAWDGTITSISDQVHKSVVSSMRGYPLYADQSSAIEAYIRSLSPPPSLPSAEENVEESAAITRGASLFRYLSCDRCHAPPVYTTRGTHDVGLSDERGLSEFNPPSLRGVGRLRRLFHDGRAGSLNEVFEEFEHQLDEPLEPAELADLVAFLKSL